MSQHCIISHTAWNSQKQNINHTLNDIPDSKVHGANMGPTWVLSAPDGLHVGSMNLAIRDDLPYHWFMGFLMRVFRRTMTITAGLHITFGGKICSCFSVCPGNTLSFQHITRKQNGGLYSQQTVQTWKQDPWDICYLKWDSSQMQMAVYGYGEVCVYRNVIVQNCDISSVFAVERNTKCWLHQKIIGCLWWVFLGKCPNMIQVYHIAYMLVALVAFV